ncbi:TPA: DnaT-like ssDNA-binding protein [Salmonella enterica subsp. diarizonae serovar 50:k:z35]
MLITDPLSPSVNSYATVDNLRQFAVARGYSLPEDDTACEELLTVAMDYLEGMSWHGQRTSEKQPLSWPRRGVMFDGVALSPDTVPGRLVDAQCRLAVEAQTVDLQPTLNGGENILSESIAGAISVSYNPDSAGELPSFPWLDTLLRGMVRSNGINFDVMRG